MSWIRSCIWVVFVPRALVDLVASARGVVVVEDGLVEGGVGSRLRDALEDGAADGGARPVMARVGVPRRFVATAERSQLLTDFDMDAAGIERTALGLGRRS